MGWSIGAAVELHVTAEGLGDGVIARALHRLLHAGLAEAGDVDDHQAGVGLPEGCVIQAQLLEMAAPRALDDDLGLRRHGQEGVAALGLGDVQSEVTLVATFAFCPHRPGRAAHHVRDFGILDPSHVGAPFGHQLSGERTGKRAAGTDDADPRQWTEIWGRLNCRRHGVLPRVFFVAASYAGTLTATSSWMHNLTKTVRRRAISALAQVPIRLGFRRTGSRHRHRTVMTNISLKSST